MRASRALLLALAAAGLLGACQVETQGAACTADTHCPSGQRCGHDRTCSRAAAACTGPICQGTICDGKDLKSCQVAADGICASLVDVATCSEHQACNPDAVTCDCVSGGCGPGVVSFCSGTGQLVTCATESGSSCRYEAPPEDCAVGRTCDGGFPAAACTCPLAGPDEGDGCDPLAAATSCKDASTLLSCRPKVAGSDCHVWRDPEDCTLGALVCSATGGAGGTPACACAEDACGGAAGSFCSAGQEVSCVFTVANGCWSEGPPAACGAGETCTGTQPAGACCPDAGPNQGDGCATAGARTCSGADLLRCAPQPSDARCLTWSLEEACGTAEAARWS